MLWPAARQELVEWQDGSYKFIHDRVQEAAYSLIPEDSRAAAHLRIGRLHLAQMPAAQREEAIFDIVNQLNRGAALITPREEREQLAELNLIAGKRAKGASAYASALAYLNAGAALLAEDDWEHRHELTFALDLNRAECEFLTGQMQVTEERLTALSKRAVTTVEHAIVACLHIDVHTTLDQSGRAVAIGLDYLRHVGIAWSSHPQPDEVRREYDRIWSLLGGRQIEDLIGLPPMDDPESLATVEVLIKVLSPARYTDANLASLTICKAVSLSLERGNCDASSVAYVRLGRIAGPRFGDYQVGFRFGQLGYDLVERRGLKRFEARTYFGFAIYIVLWMKNVRACRDLLRRAFAAAKRTGDLTYAAYSCCHINSDHLFAGEKLAEVQGEAEDSLAYANQARFGLVIDNITTQRAFIRMLRGLTPKFGCFDDAQFNELRIEAYLSSNPALAMAACWYWIRKLQARYLAGDYTIALSAASKAKILLWTTPSFFEEAEYHFYSALTQAAYCDYVPAGARQPHLDAVAAHHRQLLIWAEHCRENFENRAMLVGAEMARIEGRNFDAIRLYEQAIQSARANGFVHNEALANELASRFHTAHGFEKIARMYLQESRYGYLRWGADGKVRQLEELYPQLRPEEPASSPTSMISAPIEHLDLATVIKVSQAVSGEIVLEKMLDTLMRTAIAQAGAERGLLILSRGAEPRIEAEATTDGDTTRVHLRELPVTASLLPESVLYHVLRTHESITLDDAAAHSPFAADPYIRGRRARSVLCLPLVNQGKLVGGLYLENNLAPGAFAPTRIAALKLLASQAAIALENSHLYRDLAEREAKIRRLVDANIIGIFIRDLEGRILEANDAFLHMIGYDREDLIAGRIRWTDLTPPEWSERNAQAIAEVRMTGRVRPFEKEYFRKDGSRVPVLIGVANFEESGDEGVAFVLDLTERKRAEEALRESEDLWKAVFENNPTMYFMVDAAGIIISVNPFGAEQLGYRADELVGRPLQNLFHEADRDAALKNTLLCLKQLGRAMTWELRKIRKGGEWRWVRETARAMMIKKRPVILIVCEDITESRRAAETLREVQTELAHANRVATMGQLTASIAHEINQPIAATVMNAQAGLRWLAAEPPDLAAVKQTLTRIANDGNRAGEIIGQIRALIKKASARKDLLDLTEAIREVAALTRGEAIKNGVSVRMQLAEGLPPIEGDRVQLQQVILNLMINAIEAISGVREGARDVLVTTREADPDTVQVAVQDTGPGLEPAVLERVFDAFYTTKPHGLGLGLSICRSIIEAHGGRLWVTVNIPHGAIFQFNLPARPGGGS
jgi:PAS domain S-box-containing protein